MRRRTTTVPVRYALVLALLGAASAALVAEEDMRVRLDQAILDDLLQGERWAIMDAQSFAAKGEHQRAALEYRKFLTEYPDSLLWSYASYAEAWHCYRDRRYEAAKARLEELLDLEPEGVQAAEARLLLGRVHLAAGAADPALAALRECFTTHPQHPAALAARVLASEAVAQLGREREQTPEEVDAARLALLAPIAADLRLEPAGGRDLRHAVEQIRELAIRLDQLERGVELVEALAGLDGRVDHFDPQRELRESAQRLMDVAADRGRDALVERLAAARWSGRVERRVGLARFWSDWYQRAGRDGDELAAARGLGATAFARWLDERLTANEAELAALLADPGARHHHAAIAWTLAGRRAGDDPAAALATLDQGLGTDWSRDQARDAFRLLLERGADSTAALAVLDRLEGDERAQAELDLLEHLASRHGRAEAARRAIALCDTFAAAEPERARDYLWRKARLQERPLGDWAGAIETYEAIAEPPRTDFAIADCLGRQAEWRAAFDRYAAIAATHSGSEEGGRALLHMGRIAHRHLDDRVRAIQLLRKVCDDYPSSKAYSEAHVYLQHELDVTYTGGG